MSLDYGLILSAVATRLIGDTTISANIGTVGDSLVKCIFALRATSAADSSKPTIVITRVSSPQTSDFTNLAMQLRFDLHLFYGKATSQDPSGTGHNCFAILAAAKDRLSDWVPTASGMTCSAVFWDNEIDAHDDETWHWVQSYTVHCTST